MPGRWWPNLSLVIPAQVYWLLVTLTPVRQDRPSAPKVMDSSNDCKKAEPRVNEKKCCELYCYYLCSFEYFEIQCFDEMINGGSTFVEIQTHNLLVTGLDPGWLY